MSLMPKLIVNFFGWLLLILCSPVLALSSDQSQPLTINSDSATYDRDKHIIIYDGNVDAHQGTSNLSGDKLTIYQTPENKIDYLVTIGNPAHYNTIPEPNKGRLFVVAQKITYYTEKKIVVLEGKAEVKQDNNLVSGPYIWYDMTNGIVHSKTNNPNERTTVVIQPQK